MGSKPNSQVISQPSSIRLLYGSALIIQSVDCFAFYNISPFLFPNQSDFSHPATRFFLRQNATLLFPFILNCWFLRDHHIRHTKVGRVVGKTFALFHASALAMYSWSRLIEGEYNVEPFSLIATLHGGWALWAVWGLIYIKYILSSVDNNCRIPGLPPLPNSGQGSELDWYSIKSNGTSVQKLLKEKRKQGILLTDDDVKRATLEARLKEWEEIEEVHREMIFDDVGPQERCGKLGLGSNHSDNPKRIYEILSTQVHTAGQACT